MCPPDPADSLDCLVCPKWREVQEGGDIRVPVVDSC